MSRLVLNGRFLTRFHGARLAKHRWQMGAWAAFVNGLKGVFCPRGRNLLLADMRGGHQLLDEVIQTHFSLFDESCRWREEPKVKHLSHSPGHERLSRMKTKISALDWLICPFWLCHAVLGKICVLRTEL